MRNQKKLIALTFDDGPDLIQTPRVLEKLKNYNVKATFMMIGQFINDCTAPLIDCIVQGEYEIGNHSWGMVSLDKSAPNEIVKSVNDTTHVIEKYAKTTPHFFRPPNLSISETLLKTLNMADMIVVGGVVAYDWKSCNTDANMRAQNVLKGAQDGAIILMHDVQPEPHPTPEALDILIPALLSQNYDFVTLSELFKKKGITLEMAKEKVWDCIG